MTSVFKVLLNSQLKSLSLLLQVMGHTKSLFSGRVRKANSLTLGKCSGAQNHL